MRFIIVLVSVLFLGGVAAACALWAGISQGGPIAFACGAFVVAFGLPAVLTQDANWCVSGNEPALRWHQHG
jgi:hypothetical protein